MLKRALHARKGQSGHCRAAVERISDGATSPSIDTPRKCQERQSPAFLLDPADRLPPGANLPLHLSQRQVQRASAPRWVRWIGNRAELRLLLLRVRVA